MAFYVGSFAGGLFNGAQSAMSLYTGYQQLSSAIDASNALDQQRNADQMAQVNANVPGGWNRDTNKPYGVTEPTGEQGVSPIGAPATQSSTAGPVTQGSGVTPAAVPAAPKATPVSSTTGDSAGDKAPPAAITPPTTGAGGPGGDVDSARRKDIDVYRNANPLALTTANTPPSAVPQVKPPVPSTPPPVPDDYGRVTPPAVTPPAQPVARVPLPPQPAPFSAAGVQGPPGSPSGPPAPRPDQNPVAQAVTGIGDLIHGPSAGFTAPPAPPYTPPPPSNTQGVGGYFGSTAGSQTPPMPTGRPGGPVIPPPQPPAAVPAAGGASGTGGVPTAQAEPPSLGSKIGSVLSALNPVGTAEAAPRPPPQIPPATQTSPNAPDATVTVRPPVAPAPVPPVPAAPAAPQGVAPPPVPAAPAPAATTTPAAPPKTPQAPAVAPVPVSGGAGAKVAPGQTTPSEQSETTPLAMAPQIDPSAWGWVQANNPQLAQQIKYAVDTYGQGAVTYEQVAAHMKRESGFNVNVGTGPFGEHGVMQVMPETQASMEHLLGHPVDAKSVDGSLALGVTYLRYLAKDMGLGANTIQTNFAYMRGPGAVNFVKENGLDAANKIPSLQHALGWTENMYGGKVTLTSGVFQGGTSAAGHQGYTGQGALAASQQGPDGTLQYVSSMGPQGLGMSERWSQLQTALERQAIWSGHPEMLGHITDWVAQQSHQGAMSNLAAADNALSQGNGPLAAQFLAKAHAFFPDGTFMRAGVDGKGQLWAQQFDEGSGKTLGQSFMVSNDAIRQQMLVLQNPTNYVEALQKYQKENAQIAQVKAYGEYYRQLPDIKKAQQEGLEQRQQERLADADARQKERLQFQAQNKQAKDENTNALDKDIDTKYDPQNMPKERAPDNWAAQSEIERSLRMPESMGGSHLGGPTANSIAEGLATGKMNLERLRDKLSGKDVGYRITDKASGQERARLGLSQGEKIESLPGIPHLAGTQPPANSNQRTQNTGIGGGAGSPMVAMGGMGQNLSGVSMPPIQPSQQSAVA